MSKAVLVIDKPNCCGNCELIVSMYSDQYEDWQEACYITKKKIFDTEKIDKGCPLQIPEPLTDAEQRIFLSAT